mgnify:FL=1
MCFEEKVSYQQLKFLERFTELIKKTHSYVQIRDHFTKITAATWSINKIMLVSIALLIPMQNNLDWSISSYPRSPTLEFI